MMHYITIPGSFFHELAHQLACYMVGHRVLEVRYMVRDNPAFAGYVLHQGPPGVARHLFIGIAPLLMGFAIWAGALSLGWYFFRDGDAAIWQVAVLLLAAWATAAATYAALPSPLDMEGVFRQPFSVLTIPCYLIATPVWLISHDYKLSLWGWTTWRVVVVIGTAYVIYRLVAGDIPNWPARTGLREQMGATLVAGVDVLAGLVDRLVELLRGWQ